jgi:hypothetical protein
MVGALVLAVALMPSDVFGRGGFGGGGGGGYRGGGGGYGGGGAGGYRGGEGGNRGGDGGYRGGEGGYRPNESGYRGGEGSRANNYGGGYHPGSSGNPPNRSQLNNFLGLPTDGGAGAASAHNFSGQNLGNAASTHPYSNTWAHSQGNAAQNWSQNHPQFGQDWNANHQLAWTPTGMNAAAWGAAGWGAAAMDYGMVGNWLGMDSAPADNYDYGNNVTYQGDTVYNGNQPVASSDQYYQQASDLANNAAPPADDSQWMPLGVFAIMDGDSKAPSSTVQLAVNKQGTIRGNSTDPIGNVLPVQGSVDKKTQRVAWTVGSNNRTVYDSGLCNLTKSEAPVLVHVAQDKTDQRLMVRLKQPNQSSGDTAQDSNN